VEERPRRAPAPAGRLVDGGRALLAAPGRERRRSGPEAAVRLPAERAPGRLGTIRLEGTRATFTAAPGVAVTEAGRPVSEIALASDADPAGATRLEHGSLSFYLIARGDRLGVRVKDARAAALAAFQGSTTTPPTGAGGSRGASSRRLPAAGSRSPTRRAARSRSTSRVG